MLQLHFSFVWCWKETDLLTALNDAQKSALTEIILATVREAAEGHPPAGRGAAKKVSAFYSYILCCNHNLFVLCALPDSVLPAVGISSEMNWHIFTKCHTVVWPVDLISSGCWRGWTLEKSQLKQVIDKWWAFYPCRIVVQRFVSNLKLTKNKKSIWLSPRKISLSWLHLI